MIKTDYAYEGFDVEYKEICNIYYISGKLEVYCNSYSFITFIKKINIEMDINRKKNIHQDAKGLHLHDLVND